MQQNQIFENRAEIGLFCLFCIIILSINLSLKFYDFHQFKQDRYLVLNAKVLQSYTKQNDKGKSYRVLKLKTDKFSFYTTSKAEFEPEINARILIRPTQKNVKFIEFLSENFYMPNFGLLELRENQKSQNSLQENLRDKFYEFIAGQHDESKAKELYAALFLATPISKELRDDVNHFGIAHLVAISGYHLGLIFGVMYFCLRPFYRYFQVRHFPYRSEKFDLSAVIFTLLFGYLWLIDFVPSFLRAFLMSLFVFYLFSRNIRVISFEILAVIVALAVSFMPSLAFSVGFYFSCAGVFFIYLYLHHFKDKFSNLIHVLLLNLWVFFAMIIPVVYFFPLISFQQFSVLPLSIIFTVFYPVVALLHVLNLGGAFDEFLVWFLSLRLPSVNLNINFWIFLAYNICALIGIKSRNLAIFVVVLNLFCFLVLI